MDYLFIQLHKILLVRSIRISMIVVVVNDSDDLFVVGDVSSGCGGTSEHGRGSLDIVVV